MILLAKEGVTFDAGSRGVTYALHLNGMVSVSSSTAGVHWEKILHAKTVTMAENNEVRMFFIRLKYLEDYCFKGNVYWNIIKIFARMKSWIP